MIHGSCTRVKTSGTSRSGPSAMTSNQPLSQEVDDLDEVASGPVPVNSVSVDHRRRWASWSMSTSDVIVVGLLGFTFLIIDLHPMFYSDIWGHLKYGQWIWSHGRLPDREPFTPFADQRARYVNFQWLCQALFYLLYHAGETVAGGDEIRRTEGGVEWLRAFHAGVEVCRFVLLLVAFRRRSGSAPLACAWLALSVLLAGHGHLAIVRPQIIGEALFAGLLLALSRPVLSRFAVVVVPLTMVVWANTHGSFTIGLALLGLCLAGRAIDAWIASKRGLRAAWTDPQVRRCLGVFVASVVAIAILNPHGPWLYWYTLKLARHPNIATMIEWSPLGFDLRSGWHWNYAGLGRAGRRNPGRQSQVVPGERLLAPLRLRTTALISTAHDGLVDDGRALGPDTALRGDRRPDPRRATPARARAQRAQDADRAPAPDRDGPPLGPRPLAGQRPSGSPGELGLQRHALAGRRRAPGDGGTEGELVARAGPRSDGILPRRPDSSGAIFSSELLGDYLLWGLAPKTPIIVYSHAHLFTPAYWLHFRMTKAGMTGY